MQLSCFLHKTKTQPSDILSAFILGKPPTSQGEDRRSILVKFRHHETATEIKRSAKTVKPEGLFFSENLTPLRHSILKALRKAKYAHSNIISGCGSWEGRVFVWIKPSNPAGNGVRSRRFSVNNLEELRKFCSDILNESMELYAENY